MAGQVQERSIANLKYRIQKKQNELEGEKDRIAQLEKELASFKSRCLKYEIQLETQKKDFSLLTLKNTKLKDQIRGLEESVKRLTKDSLEKAKKEEENEQLIHKISDLESSLNDKLVEINTKDEILRELTRQVDVLEEKKLENAISQVEKRKDSIARVTEIKKLKARISILEGKLSIQKNKYDTLKAEHQKFEESANPSGSFPQKQTYETYILTLQTELYDIKHELEESKRERAKQKEMMEKLDSKITQINLQPQYSKIEPIQKQILVQTQESSSGEKNVFPLPSQTSMSPIDQERDNQLMEFFTKLTKKIPTIKAMAFIGYNGDLYFQTSPWFADNESLKFIQDWQAKASTVCVKDLKFLTVYVDSEVLTATNEEGQSHLLCSVLDENLFVIILIKTTAPILDLYEDLKYLLPVFGKLDILGGTAV